MVWFTDKGGKKGKLKRGRGILARIYNHGGNFLALAKRLGSERLIVSYQQGGRYLATQIFRAGCGGGVVWGLEGQLGRMLSQEGRG